MNLGHAGENGRFPAQSASFNTHSWKANHDLLDGSSPLCLTFGLRVADRFSLPS